MSHTAGGIIKGATIKGAGPIYCYEYRALSLQLVIVQVQYFPDTQFSEQHDLSRYDIGIIHLLTVSGNRNHRRQLLCA